MQRLFGASLPDLVQQKCTMKNLQNKYDVMKENTSKALDSTEPTETRSQRALNTGMLHP